MLKKLQVNTIDKDFEDNVEFEEEELDAINEDHPNNTGFFVDDGDLVSVISQNLAGT
jgi:hypothetical protein